jgi:peptidoglycan/LPS O-acetylase OafA/YrhL
MSNTTAHDGEYMPQLDGLRTVAVSAVLLDHFTPIHHHLPFVPGSAGVWLFFVLSGYLITGILLRARERAPLAPGGLKGAWLSFYMRRILRIWPLFYVVLFTVVALDLPGTRSLFPWFFSHLSNWGFVGLADGNSTLLHFWSLAVEEQFYLVWPLAVLFAPRRYLVPVVVAAIVFAPISYVLLMATKHDSLAHWATTSYLNGLGMGSLLALVGDSPGARRPLFLRIVLAAGLAVWLVSVAGRLAGLRAAWTFVPETCGYALMSVWLVDRAASGFPGWAGRTLTLAPINYLGRISYGIYVLHFPVKAVFGLTDRKWGLWQGLATGDGPASFVFLYAATVLCASVSWYLLEKPMNDLKRYFPYPRISKVPVSLPAAVAVELI